MTAPTWVLGSFDQPATTWASDIKREAQLAIGKLTGHEIETLIVVVERWRRDDYARVELELTTLLSTSHAVVDDPPGALGFLGTRPTYAEGYVEVEVHGYILTL
jgi:hypothetical protein